MSKKDKSSLQSGESNESSSKSSDASITSDLTDSKTLINTIRLPPQLLQLLKLLPPNYDITKIPNEVMQTVSKNEIPDFALLPADLQQHLMNNIHNVVNALADKVTSTSCCHSFLTIEPLSLFFSFYL